MWWAACWPAFWGEIPARRHRMVIEISVICVGAVLVVVLLLMLLSFTSGQTEKFEEKDHMGRNNTGNYLFSLIKLVIQSTIFVLLTLNEQGIFSAHLKLHLWSWSNGLFFFVLLISPIYQLNLDCSSASVSSFAAPHLLPSQVHPACFS